MTWHTALHSVQPSPAASRRVGVGCGCHVYGGHHEGEGSRCQQERHVTWRENRTANPGPATNVAWAERWNLLGNLERHRARFGANCARRGREGPVGTPESALDSMAWPTAQAAADRARCRPA